jgi:RimJ/RimL family protein N-acetyltransferase
MPGGLNGRVARSQFRLETERLTIRPLARTDIARFTAYRNDPDVARYQDWDLPYTRDAAHALIDALEPDGRPRNGEWVQLAITDSDDRLVGDLAVWLDAHGQLAMIGYTLSPDAQGKGHATEAVAELVRWLLTQRKVHRVTATIDPANVASARVLERCGFRYIGTARSAALVRGRWEDDARFELLLDDWKQWTRRRRPAKRVRLVEITEHNVREVGELDRAFSQRRFVSSVHQSYGDALVAPRSAKPVTPWYRAIVADGEPAGFVMVAERPTPDGEPYLWRFLIDWRHQGRGIGRQAIVEVAQHFGAAGATRITLGCVAGVPGSPEPFYLRLGFRPTGHIDEWGETEMVAEIAVLLG